MAPLRVADEVGHMYRSYLVSEGYCTGVPAIGIPADYRDLDHQLMWRQLSKTNNGRDLLGMVDNAHGFSLPVVSLFYALNLYSCVPYLPAGAAFTAGRAFTASPLTLMYLGRFANLFFYLLMVLVAMRLLPDFQLPIAVLALMPMSLHQAASLSADSVTNALAFVLTAYILRLATTGDPARLRKSDYLLLFAGALISGLVKSNAGLLFLLLLVPAVRFPNRRTRWLTVAGCIVLAYATFGAWQYINRPNGEVHETLKIAAGIYPTENTAFIIHHPVLFTEAIGKTIAFMGREYLDEFVGKLGWFDIPLPGWISWLYLLLLIGVTVACRAGPQLAGWQRILLIGIFLVNVLSLYVALWAKEAIRAQIATGSVIIAVSGRYLIPFALLPMIAASCGIGLRFRRRLMPALAVLALTAVLVMNAVALRIVWNRFQAHSSTMPNRLRMALKLDLLSTPRNAAARYDDRVVSTRTPGEAAYFVSEGSRHLIPNKSAVTTRGFRWPEDILLISDQDLAAIPSGPPIGLAQGSNYEGQIVRRPGSSVEDIKVYVIRDGEKHWVTDGKWFPAHGFKWPDDLKTIPASELDKIPQGDEIH